MNTRKKLIGLTQLMRLDLSFSAGMCVVVGEIIALSGVPTLRETILGFSCGFLISSSVLILNDYFDLESDRVNAPTRALPSGLFSKSDIVYLALSTKFLGLYFALLLGLDVLLIVILILFIGFLYNWKLKKSGLLGNIMVASSVAFTFIVGSMAVGDPWNLTVWIFSLMAFLINLGEEISADAMDLEGDKLQNSRSIAIVWGKKVALKVSSLFFGLAVFVSFFPLIFVNLRIVYLLAIVIIDGNIIYYVPKLLKSKTDTEGRKYIVGIYRGAMIGIAILILGFIIF